MNLNLDGYERPDPSDVAALARHWLRIRVGSCLEHHSDDPDTVDWVSEILREAEEYHRRGPDGYLAYVGESYETASRARLERDFQDVIDGISLSGTDRPTPE